MRKLPNLPGAKDRVFMVQFKRLCFVSTLAIMLLPLGGDAAISPSQLQKSVVKEEKEADTKKQTVAEEPTIPLGPEDRYNRGVPRSAVEAFLDWAGKGEFEEAANYLDMRNLPRYIYPRQGAELARQLYIVLERSLWIDFHALSSDPEGYVEDGLIVSRDRIGRIESDGKNFDILMQRVPRKDGTLIWKFSSSTVAGIPELYQIFGYGPLGEQLVKILPPHRILGMQIWEWVTILGIFILSYCIAWIATKLGSHFFYRKKDEIFRKVGDLVADPICYLLTFLIARSVILGTLQPSFEFKALLKAETFILALFGWTLIRFVEILKDYLHVQLEKKERQGAVFFLKPLANTVKILVVIVLVLVWFENIGFKATTVLAGIGIGGLAVALAGQKTIENLIGAITLYISAPVKVGDFCRVGSTLGTVEEIGLRYTKMRTLDRTVLNMSNAAFADMKLENYTRRDQIWYHPTLQLSRDATPDQIRYILVAVRKMFYAHPKVNPDPARIRFETFGTYSLDLGVFLYVCTQDYSEFLEITEDLNLRIMDIIEEAGASLALPAEVVKYERKQPPDLARVTDIKERVNQWIQGHKLHLPRFPEDTIQSIRKTIQYPPEGSSTGEKK